MTKPTWVAIFEGFVGLFWDFVVTWFWILVGNYTPAPGFVPLAHKTGIRNLRKYIFLAFLLFPQTRMASVLCVKLAFSLR